MQGKEAIKSQKLRSVFEGTDIQIAEINVSPYINCALEDHVTYGHENGMVSIPVCFNR